MYDESSNEYLCSGPRKITPLELGINRVFNPFLKE